MDSDMEAPAAMPAKDLDLDVPPSSEPEGAGGGDVTNGVNGSVFDIAMEEMNREEEEDGSQKNNDTTMETEDGSTAAKTEDDDETKAEAKENGEGEAKEGGGDAFDDMLSGKANDGAGNAKTTIPKDAFDSMLSPNSTEGNNKEEEDGDNKEEKEEGEGDGGANDTVLSVPADPEPEVVVSSSEEEVETEVETEEEVEEAEPFDVCTSMVGHMVGSPPEDYQPVMVKKTVKKMVKRMVRRKKGRKTRGRKGMITIDDDGPVHKWAANIPSDEVYFEQKVEPEAIEWFKENGPKIETAGDSGLKCTSCFRGVSMALNTAGGMWRHALLGVPTCKKCREFYKDGDGWEKDDEGLDIYCRWCAQGGEIILCDKCPKAFCRTCVQRNMGRKKLQEITNADEWKCFCCDPKQLYEMQALYWAVWQRYKSGNYKKPSEIRKEKEKEKKEAAKKSKNERQQKLAATNVIKNPKNFVDENISEAFNTLKVYQKVLEQERDRWVKAGQNLNVNSATAVCRALRKIYAITKQNMDLLDKAVVQSFVENYPRDSTRIHMGKVGIKLKEGHLTGKPTKIKPGMKVKLKTPAPKPKKKKSIVLNGSPVYADPDEDDIFVGSPAKGGSRSRPGPKSKVTKVKLTPRNNRPGPKSAQKKRRHSSDDEIVVLSDSDDEPGPSSGKKRKPGPASKTQRR